MGDVQSGAAEPFAGAIVLINTRWHEDDLSGRLLLEAARGGDQWDVLDLPAIMGNGEALWPSKYPIARLNEIKRASTVKRNNEEAKKLEEYLNRRHQDKVRTAEFEKQGKKVKTVNLV
jgi:hypothetical protein